MRGETAATLSALLILSTLWTRLLRALRYFRAPVVLVAILGMTYRYMFLFLATARDMFESRESRIVGVLEPADRRRLAAASAGVLLGKTLQVSGEVHMAMQARGFRGEIRLLDELQMRAQRLAAAGRVRGRGHAGGMAGAMTELAFDVREVSYRYNQGGGFELRSPCT